MTKESAKETKNQHLSPLNYGKAKRLWELGSSTLQEIADEFGVHKSSLWERFQRDGVTKGSRVAEILEKMDESVSDEAEKMTQRIAETREQHYKYAEAIGKMTMQAIVSARSNGKSVSGADPDLAALMKAAKTLEVVRRERYTLLGLDSDGADPNEQEEILITEMSEEQIADLQSRGRTPIIDEEGINDLLEDVDVVEEEGEQ